jgi:hypothetical protein
VKRDHQVKVTLNVDELARLDELRPRGTSRAACLRSLLREPSREPEIASRDEALSILTSLARDGRVSAAIALERALREHDTDPSDPLDDLLRDR